MQKLTADPNNPMQNRLMFVDWARGFAIALALFSHVMLGSGGWDALRESAPMLYGLRVLTRMATPTFILLFGLSVELAYVPKWTTAPRATIRRIFRRVAQCYAALFAVGAAALVGGLVSPVVAAESIVFLAPVINGDIFLFYVFALLLLPLVIVFRLRFGLTVTLIATLAWWPISVAIKPAIAIPSQLDFLVSRMTGLGDGAGPSVFHAMPLVVLGMIVAAYIRPKNEGDTRRGRLSFLALFIGLIVVVLIDGPFAAVQNYAQDYRAANHPGYYLIGGMFALLILAVCRAIEQKSNLFSRERPGAFGRNSLVAFAAGNVIINLGINFVTSDSVVYNLLLATAFVGIYWFLFRWWATSQKQTIRNVPQKRY